MKSIINSSAAAIKVLLLLLSISLFFSCINPKNNNADNAEHVQNPGNDAPNSDSITINGTVTELTFGKDGYTAQVQTEKEGVYAALVSIVNVGGREHYQTCNVGDKVTFKGIASTLGDAKQLLVKEVVHIVAANTQDLEAKYSKVAPKAYCWQSNKVLDLHSEPRLESKVEGKHFAGELLQVLGVKTVDNQLWVNVTYTLKIKAGYESQFADGQVMSSGSPTGWIGGAKVPEIECK